MPKLTQMPTQDQWTQNTGSSSIPAMVRVGQLLQDWHLNTLDQTRRQVDEFLIERATKFLLKNTGSGSFFSPANSNQTLKVGGELGGKQRDYVKDVHEYAYHWVKFALDTDDFGYDQAIVAAYGKSVTDHGVLEDMKALRERAENFRYITNKGEQIRTKISFRNGIAHRWNFANNSHKGKGELVLYDTYKFRDHAWYEFGASTFAMGMNGGIYTGHHEHVEKHSCILGGAPVLCAGNIRFIEGRLAYIVGKSGHYHPTVQQYVNLLGRLTEYQVDLTNVKIFRMHYAGGVIDQQLQAWAATWGLPPNIWRGFQGLDGEGVGPQGCNAADLLSLRAWPGDNTADKLSLFVQRPQG
jgi:hypothetical protein